MANLTIDIAEGAGFLNQLDISTGLVTQRGTRIGTVVGFTGETTKEEAAAYAMSIVMAACPLGFPYSPRYPGCICTRAEITGQSSDSVRITLSFETPSLSGNKKEGNPWTIASSSRQVSEVTEFSLTSRPFLLKWVNPKDKADVIGPRMGRLTYETTQRGYTCTATLPLAKVEELEDSEDLVNDAEWSGRPRGHWRIVDVNSTRPIGSKFATVTITVLSRRPKIKGSNAFNVRAQARDWSEYIILENQNTNRPIILDPQVVTKLLAEPYDINPVFANGIVKVGPYMISSFRDLFGVDDIRRP